MYQPTEQERRELGLWRSENPIWVRRKVNNRVDIDYDENRNIWALRMYGNAQEIYPTSKSDIETLIRLFSKP